MKDSEHVIEQFSDYYDGLLDPVEQAVFEAHLEQCAKCRREYQAYQASLTWLHQLPNLQAPVGLAQRIAEKVSGARSERWARYWLWSPRIPYEIFVVLMLAVVGALYLMKDLQTSQQEQYQSVGAWLDLDLELDKAYQSELLQLLKREGWHYRWTKDHRILKVAVWMRDFQRFDELYQKHFGQKIDMPPHARALVILWIHWK